jgi:hypothetical protein
MDNSDKTVQIMGIKFLKCQQEDCEWNVGWLGGTDWTEERGTGTRICNLGAKAMIETDAVPPDHCQRSAEVLEAALAEFEF